MSHSIARLPPQILSQNCWGIFVAVVAAHHLISVFLQNCCRRARLHNGTLLSTARLFSANFLAKLLRAFCCSGGCSPSACCFSWKLLPSCAAGHWNAPFHCAPFSVNSLAELVGAGCCGGGGSPPCCAWAAGTLFLLLFTRRLHRVCFFCRATVPAEHSARFVFVLVAGLTKLIACCALALQNPP